MTTLTPPPPVVKRKRTRRDPNPRFKASIRDQLDVVSGCPAVQVSKGHLARRVWRIVERFDVKAAEAKYSSLGRRGYHPRNLLAVWIYASLVGLHEASKVARALQTDAAYRFLSGGYAVSPATLKRFRQHNAALFRELLGTTVKLAHAEGLVEPREIAVDSVRLRAHASKSAVRTASRSRERLRELAGVDVNGLSDDQRAKHEQKVKKHQDAIARCEALSRPNHVITNEAAGLLKFPDGGSGPGHRVTVAASGVTERIVVGVLIDADSNDYGKLGPTVRDAYETLKNAGVPAGTVLQVAADPGYFSEKDLAFAAENRGWVDVLIKHDTPAKQVEKKPSKYFGHEAFKVEPNGVTCPAGNSMAGPYPDPDGSIRWQGRGCGKCPLRPKCTDSPRGRQIGIRPRLEQVRSEMLARMAQPDAEQRYRQRLATIEPVFSNIESTMMFRRASSRHSATVNAEILLKLLAHNVSRLAKRSRFFIAFVALNEF